MVWHVLAEVTVPRNNLQLKGCGQRQPYRANTPSDRQVNKRSRSANRLRVVTFAQPAGIADQKPQPEGHQRLARRSGARSPSENWPYLKNHDLLTEIQLASTVPVVIANAMKYGSVLASCRPS